jgi:hypothetical protein
MPLRPASALRLVTALLLLAALPALARAAPRGRPHRDVSAAQEQDCATCHRTATPAVTTAWEASPHGVSLVKCLVCHGSTGRDFRARPASDGCRACHASQVETLAHRAPRAPKDCFACHSPHALSPNPHR